MKLALSIPVSLLPDPYRRRLMVALEIDPSRGALLSGLVQCVACVLVFCFRYLTFLQNRVGRFAEDLIARNAELAMDSVSVQWGAGMISLGEYMIHPGTVALVYFAFEGLVRWVSALLHGEAVPTLPLQLIAWAHLGLSNARERRKLGPLVEDLVLQDGISPVLRIATCRPKSWNCLTTISYDDKLYELAGEEQGSVPRRWVYVLRPRPEYKVVRGVYHYDPQELVRQEK